MSGHTRWPRSCITLSFMASRVTNRCESISSLSPTSSSPLLSPSSFVGRRLLFNFLGTFGSQEEENDGAPWRFAFDPIVDATWNSARNSRSHDLIFDGIVVDGKLSFNFSFCPAIDAKEGAERLASGFKENLVGIVAAAGAQEHFWQQQISALRDAAELPEEVEGHGREARGRRAGAAGRGVPRGQCRWIRVRSSFRSRIYGRTELFS